MPATDIVPFDASPYPILSSDGGADLAEVIAENVGEGGFSAFDLERVKIPAGGGGVWEVPGLNGVEAVKSLEGIVVLWSQPRSYWEKGLDEAGSEGTTPPDCASDNGTLGYGIYGVGSDLHPEGDCASCPMNEWKSDDNGRGKACSEQRLLYMLLPGQVLPTAVQLPPTSVQPWRQYMMRLSGAGVPYYGIVTRLGLRQAKNAGNQTYSVAVPEAGARLATEARDRAKAYRADLQSMLAATTRTTAERAGTSPPPAPAPEPEPSKAATKGAAPKDEWDGAS